MKAEVTEIFQDKITRKMHNVGDVIDIEDKDRLADLTERGLVRVVEDSAIEKPTTTRRRKK